MAQKKKPDKDKVEKAQVFARKLAEHLTERYKESYEVLPPLKETYNLWYIRSPSILAIRECSDHEGIVYIYSYDLFRLDYLFGDDDIDDPDDIVRFLEELKDRDNWDHLSKRVCPHVVAYLTWAENIAKKVSEEYKVEVEQWFPSKEYPALKRTALRAVIDTRGISEEEKIKAIEERVPAVAKAWDLAADRTKWEPFVAEFVRKAKFGKTPNQ